MSNKTPKEKPMNELHEHIKERIKIWEWLCRGYGIHGLEFRDFKNLTKEWLIKNYNLSEEYFKITYEQ